MIFLGIKKDPILINKPGKILGHFGNQEFEKSRPRILDVGGSVVEGCGGKLTGGVSKT